MPVTAAVIGCGRIGSLLDADRPPAARADVRTHAGAYATCPDTVLVAGVDPLPGQRDHFERAWGVRAYATVDEMVREVRPQLWSVCTPPADHASLVRAAVDGGARAVWCEKPFVRDTADAEPLIALAAARQVGLGVNYLRRWDAAYQAAAARIHSGAIGQPQHACVRYTRGLRNYASHAIDLLRWFLGEAQWAWGHPACDVLEPDQSPSALVGFGSAVASFLPVDSTAFELFEVDVVGTDGRLMFSDLGRTATVARVGPGPEPDEPRVLLSPAALDVPHPAGGAMLAAAANMAAAAAGRESPRCTGRDGLAALRVCEAIERSISRGEKVRPES